MGKPWRIAIGVALIGLGLAMLVLPGPGILMIILGIGQLRPRRDKAEPRSSR